MRHLRRKLLSQNFLHSRRLVADLLASSSLGKTDLVLEIGPGKGIITEELISRSAHVIGVELDSYRFTFLKEKFSQIKNLLLYNEDILNFSLPRIPYKVFSNIPFSIEGKIVRKLIDAPNPPVDCYLVVIKELAERLSGLEGENQFSLCHKPWFDFSIVHYFSRTDFTPWPKVDPVLFRFTKRDTPLLSLSFRESFSKFIADGFGNGLPVSKNLSKRFNCRQVLTLLSRYNLRKDTLPNKLPLSVWLSLYKDLLLS